ncbi:MAG TPA: threonine/serine dehydratase [Gemmatimonadales bacterium]|jgi:threonine dehydratase
MTQAPLAPTVDPTTLVPLSALHEAAALLEGVVARTPLLEVPALSAQAGVPVALKCEQLQVVGAFKLRGAYNAVARVAAAGRARGVVTQSSGNHGQAVAFAARAFGLRAVVVMPSSTPMIKVEGVRRHGGEVVFAGVTRSPEQLRRAEAIARDEGLEMIPPYDHPDVVAGQGTVGLEILEQRPDVATILVPVSGGGLISGISVAVAALRPRVNLIGVEPAGAPKLSAALAAGAPRALDHTESIADGLLARSIGAFTFPILRRVVRMAVQVSESDIAEAVRFLHHEAGLMSEPSGAVAVAALLAGLVRPSGPTVAVLSGGNVDPDLYHRLVG